MAVADFFLASQWKYRGAFEARLPVVFDHFGSLYSSFKAQAGRLSAEQFKSQLSNVLDVLEIWFVPASPPLSSTHRD